MGYQDKQNAHTRVTLFVYRLFINLGLFLYDENKRKMHLLSLPSSPRVWTKW